jgi:hypothetical protein
MPYSSKSAAAIAVDSLADEIGYIDHYQSETAAES